MDAYFYEIYFQGLDQVNTGKKSRCVSAQKFLLKSVHEVKLEGFYNYICVLLQIKIIVLALTFTGNGPELVT